MAKLAKNQTKIFVATTQHAYDCEIIHGCNLTLEAAWKRHKGEPDDDFTYHWVYELPLDSPINFDDLSFFDGKDKKHGMQKHKNPAGKL